MLVCFFSLKYPIALLKNDHFNRGVYWLLWYVINYKAISTGKCPLLELPFWQANHTINYSAILVKLLCIFMKSMSCSCNFIVRNFYLLYLFNLYFYCKGGKIIGQSPAWLISLNLLPLWYGPVHNVHRVPFCQGCKFHKFHDFSENYKDFSINCKS